MRREEGRLDLGEEKGATLDLRERTSPFNEEGREAGGERERECK